jgi:HSF-type DNA-binding
MNSGSNLPQDSSDLSPELRLLLGMSSPANGASLSMPLNLSIPSATLPSQFDSAAGYLQQMLPPHAASGSFEYQAIHDPFASHGLASFKAEHAAGLALTERALVAERSRIQDRAIQHERTRMVHEYLKLTLVINEMKSRATVAAQQPEALVRASPVEPVESLQQSFVSERSQIAMDSSSKSPEKVFYILNVLGSTLRSKSDPYIDASVYTDPGTNRAVRGGIVELFPDKLYRMLMELQAEGRSDVASFLPHGRSFIVHKMDVFLKEILPRFFSDQSKWSSFSRQLNLYGFLRCNSGPDCGSYYHELFLLNHPNLCNYMRRVGAPKGIDRRRHKHPEGKDPNFYEMPPLRPQQKQG